MKHRFRRHADAENDRPQEERIGIVVLTHDRREEALRTLEYMPHRHDIPIILVDNASSDGTVDAVRKRYPNVAVVPLQRNIGAAARNAGVLACRARYIAFCDDDTCWYASTL